MGIAEVAVSVAFQVDDTNHLEVYLPTTLCYVYVVDCFRKVLILILATVASNCGNYINEKLARRLFEIQHMNPLSGSRVIFATSTSQNLD